ncbi:SAM-dependent chlorinase/fluorinase [Candidatus Aerophobetes bacterium]|nr:SAM-dependent chlorinase/fluorinase [Candidatus Aerophobetes bacterium]
MKTNGILTLTTDFSDDIYVGQMKGVIVSINPEARIIDLTHRIKSFGILEAAFFISQVCPTFPPGTVHIVVIHPGVGTKRREIILLTDRHFYIGPDNGIFHFVKKIENLKKVVEIDMNLFKDACFTFHGRDIFAPVGAYLSSGRKMEEFGKIVDKDTIVSLSLPEGCIIYIDAFGNIITNIKKEFFYGDKLIIKYGNKKVKATFARTFSEVKEGEYVVLRGSSGYLEVDKNKSSAADELAAKTGEKISISRPS